METTCRAGMLGCWNTSVGDVITKNKMSPSSKRGIGGGKHTSLRRGTLPFYTIAAGGWQISRRLTLSIALHRKYVSRADAKLAQGVLELRQKALIIKHYRKTKRKVLGDYERYN